MAGVPCFCRDYPIHYGDFIQKLVPEPESWQRARLLRLYAPAEETTKQPVKKSTVKKSLQILRIVKCLFYGFLRLGSCSLAITGK